MEKVKKFTEEFFLNLKCVVEPFGEGLKVDNVPKSFEDLLGKKAPYVLSFVSGGEGDFVGKGSLMMEVMMKYLKGSGKTTILRIDFDVDPEKEIKKRVGFRNCELTNLVKSNKNNFFSRFSFATIFNYLNESERVLGEVYVHDGKVVDGDLDGYTVVDGDDLRVDSKKVKRDYEIAKERVLELVRGKQEEIALGLKEKVEVEVDRIRAHYDSQLKEVSSDLNGRIEKIREVEMRLRVCLEEEVLGLKNRLERLRKGLVQAGDEGVIEGILNEREMTVKDAVHKFSLNVDRKLLNTTVIYYPVYSFRLHLKGAGERLIDVEFDPLTKGFRGLECEECGKVLDRVSLCGEGHVCCEGCLDRCGECGEVFCGKCLNRSCASCGRRLCKGCVKMCLRCGSVSCGTHMRKDSVSGEERCVGCLRACLRCGGSSEERYFGEAMDGSKVCGKCLGAEKRGEILGRVFDGS